MVRKIFFCSEFPVIPEKWWRKEEEEKQLRSILLFKHKCNKCFFDYLNLSFILIYTLDAIKNNSFELNKNFISKTFNSNFQETYIRFDYRPGSGRGYAPPGQGNSSSTSMS